MKIKKLLSLLLVLVMCFALASCGEKTTADNGKKDDIKPSAETTEPVTEQTSSDEVEDGVKPLLYRVTDADGSVIWLFGSIHVGREEFYPLPDYVMDAFNEADSLAVEADIVAFEEDIAVQTQALSKMMYLDGTTIKDYIPEDLYNSAVEIMTEYDYYMPQLDYYCPSMWSSLIRSLVLEGLGIESELGVDMHLLKKAYEEEKEILEVESVQMQYEMLAGFSDEIQLLLLEASVEMYDEIDDAEDEMNQLLDLWASGDEEEFAKVINEVDEEMTEEEQELYDEYNKEMTVNRNIFMTDYAEDALADGGDVFICVGAAHVVGEGAMADLLSERGYTVELVTK